MGKDDTIRRERPAEVAFVCPACGCRESWTNPTRPGPVCARCEPPAAAVKTVAGETFAAPAPAVRQYVLRQETPPAASLASRTMVTQAELAQIAEADSGWGDGSGAGGAAYGYGDGEGYRYAYRDSQGYGEGNGCGAGNCHGDGHCG